MNICLHKHSDIQPPSYLPFSFAALSVYFIIENVVFLYKSIDFNGVVFNIENIIFTYKKVLLLSLCIRKYCKKT